MKTASVLFGLMVATSVANASPTSSSSTSTARPTARTLPVASTLPAAMRSLLRQSPTPGVKLTPTVARPRADAAGDMACGNVMSKSSTDRCTARIASQQAPAPQVVARPVVDKSGDVAPGNVMKVLKK